MGILRDIRNIESGHRELRNFGWTIGTALALIGAYFAWRGSGEAIWLVYLGAAAVVFGSVVPYVLWPLQKIWMAISIVIGRIMTPVILTVIYFIVFGITRMIGAVLGKRFLELKIDRASGSYWRERTGRPSVESYQKEF